MNYCIKVAEIKIKLHKIIFLYVLSSTNVRRDNAYEALPILGLGEYKIRPYPFVTCR